MAWAEPMGSGRFRGVYRDPVPGPDGKRHRHTVTDGGQGFARKRDAKKAADDDESKARRRAGRRKSRVSASIPWGDFWDQIESDRDYASDNLSREQSIVKVHLRPKWGAVPLNEITDYDADTWFHLLATTPGRKGQPLSSSYIHRIYRTFAVSMNAAVKRGILDVSPLADVTLPQIIVQPRPYLTHNDVAERKKHLRKDYSLVEEFMLETGLRPSELCGMHPESLKEPGWIEVWHVMVEGKKVIRPWPKNKKMRKVPLTSRAVEILGEVMADRDLTGGCGVPHHDGVECKSDLVFRTARGKPFYPNGIRARSHYASTAWGLDPLSPYSARRGFITWAAPFMDPFALQKIAGHSSEGMTARYHQLDEAERKRLLAAKGEAPSLTVVEGQRGADRGAEPSKQTPNDAEPQGGENAV